MRKPTLFIATVAAVGFILLLYWRYQRPATPDPNLAIPSDKTIEYFFRGANARHYRKSGSLHYEFESDYLEYFEATDTTEVSLPKIIMYLKDGTPWHARSDTASVLNQNKTIHLQGNVFIEQRDDTINMKTEELYIIPARDYAETNSPVTITSPAGKTYATGMTLDLQKQRLHLLSKVRSSYVPQP